MKGIRLELLLLGIFLAISPCGGSGKRASRFSKRMASPAGHVRAEVFARDGNLLYSIAFHGEDVILPSALGIVVDGDTVGRDAKIRYLGRRTIRETYPTRGFHDKAVNRSVRYEFALQRGRRSARLQFQLSEEGVAYRYLWDEDRPVRIGGELSSFRPPEATPVWFFERPNSWKLKSYAGLWTETVSDSLGSISPEGPVQGAPLVFALPSGKYMALTEAALYHYSGMRFRADAEGSLMADFTEGAKGFEVAAKGQTPWRVILLASDLDGLVSSDLLSNLNPPPDIEGAWTDVGGTCAWSWWSDTSSPEDPEKERKVTDQAAALGCRWSLIDEGWEKWPLKWSQLREICAHARENKVGVFVWKHQAEISDTTADYLPLRTFLDSLVSCGVSGVKVDFFNGETKVLVDLQEAILSEAARRGLLVLFHGCQKPTGEFRRYPNEITREAIRGLELNKMGRPLPAAHNVALVFTRCILGNADYTPIGFSNPGNTTWAHQLATAYAFTSPMTVIAESPGALLSNPAYAPALPFIREMPTCWDETRVLPGSDISKRALLARRKGNTWYVIALNGEEPAVVDVRLDFLPEGRWRGCGLLDSPDRTFVSCEDAFLPGGILTVPLSAGGGALWRLDREAR